MMGGYRRGELWGKRKEEKGKEDKSVGRYTQLPRGVGGERWGSQRNMCMLDSGGCCHRVEKGKWGS